MGGLPGDADGDDGNSGDVVRGDRFAGGPAREFLSSLAADERIFRADLNVDRAHVLMLAEQGILTESETAAILTALSEIDIEGHGELPDGEDVHAAIETAVIDRVGADGGKMHTARSRNDEVATCIRYRLRSDLLEALPATLSLRSALLAVAREHTGTVMPGYTHRQPAQPTTVAHFLLSYEAGIRRDTSRLVDAYDRTNQSPLGAAAFAGTTFEVDRERTAELLGFDGVLGNAMDAVSTRDFALESTAALSNLAVTLSGLATDLVEYSTDGYVELSDDYASTSSIMPQKKNPDSLELVRSSAGQAAGALQGLTTTLKGLPRAYNRDLQNATPHLWRAVDAVVGATEVAAGAVDTAEWNEAAMAADAGDGFSTATGVADCLARAGIPFRTAHEIVAEAGRIETGTPGYETIAAAAEGVLDEPLSTYVDPGAVESALDPAASVASRGSRGGPAPEVVEEAIAGAAARVETDRVAVEDRRESVERAADELHEEVHSYV
jgi:argininosuccinate lyase